MNRKLKRPGLRFIASLPTLCLKEDTYKNTILWKVETTEPVIIMYDSYPVVNTFWVEIITDNLYDENKGWYSKMFIGIKRTKTGHNYIIPPHNEDFYTKIKWWSWENKGMWK